MSAQLGGRARLVGRSLMPKNMRPGLAKLQRRDGTTPGDVCRPLGFRQFRPLLPFLLGPVEQRQTGRLRLLCAGLGLFKPLPERPAWLVSTGVGHRFSAWLPPVLGSRHGDDFANLQVGWDARSFPSPGQLRPTTFRFQGSRQGRGRLNGEASPSRSLGTGPT